jgi:hypothetical protein
VIKEKDSPRMMENHRHGKYKSIGECQLNQLFLIDDYVHLNPRWGYLQMTASINATKNTIAQKNPNIEPT